MAGWWYLREGTPVLQPPPPEVTERDPELPELPPARLAAPIRYDLTSILQELEEAVPRTFGNLDERVAHPDNDRVEVAFHAERGPFLAYMSGDTARIEATLEYGGRAWYDLPLLPAVSASCGTDPEGERPRARLELASPLSLDEEWRLRSRARVVQVEAVSEADRDRCRITPLRIDVTGTALGGVRAALEGRREQIDGQVAEVDVRSRLQEVWHTLEEPVELTDDVWLVVRPEEVVQGRILGEGAELTVEVGMTARPVILLGPRPDRVWSDLPLLRTGEVPAEAEILLEARFHYPEAGRTLLRELGEREVELVGGVVRIRDLAIRGIGDGRVALEVSFGGTASGTLFLVGTPAYDPVAGEIHVPDLEFDVHTRNLLVGGLSWLGHARLVEFLRERARIPTGVILDAAGEQLARGINRELSDRVVVEGEVLGTRLLRLVALREALVIQAAAEARAEFRVAMGER